MICEQLPMFVEIGRRKIKGSLRIKEATEFLKYYKLLGQLKARLILICSKSTFYSSMETSISQYTCALISLSVIAM